MKKIGIIVLFTFAKCNQSDKEYTSQAPLFENVNYFTLTNETTNGGSQIGYLKSDLKENDVVFCFCDAFCTRKIITVFELLYNKDSIDFRFKVKPNDPFTTKSSKVWCMKVN
tara:strand:- start:5997 stop:6332 length:336 start_codon:yes stop_codon:yes gene_type:complete